jgi:hypothetical protein
VTRLRFPRRFYDRRDELISVVISINSGEADAEYGSGHVFDAVSARSEAVFDDRVGNR